jgi:DNA-binding NarL/FixJ family response regulator
MPLQMLEETPLVIATSEVEARAPIPKDSNMKAKVLIVDDHEIVREGIRRLLSSSRPEWEICGEAGDGKQAIDAVKRLDPNVVVLDITMPGMTGFEATSHILKIKPNCRILIFTMHDSDRLSAEMRNVGAHGYVQKSQASSDLVRAIECLLQGKTYFNNGCTEDTIGLEGSGGMRAP